VAPFSLVGLFLMDVLVTVELKVFGELLVVVVK
jgi:hypothetical protein